MYIIICKDLTGLSAEASAQAGDDCDFVAEGETKEEVKEKFYAHGAESPLHKERYHSATPEEAAAFGKAVDEYLAAQG